jgi:hypothetical protein
VRHEENEVKIIASEIYPLEEAPKLFAERLSIHLPAGHLSDELMMQLRGLLEVHPGQTPVIVCLQFPSGEKVFLDTDNVYKVTCEESLVAKIEHLVGEGSVYVAVNPSPCRKPPRRPRFKGGGENGSGERPEG